MKAKLTLKEKRRRAVMALFRKAGFVPSGKKMGSWMQLVKRS